MRSLRLIFKRDEDSKKMHEEAEKLNEELRQFFYKTYYEQIGEDEMKAFALKACTEGIHSHAYRYFPSCDITSEQIYTREICHWGNIDHHFTNVTWTVESVLRPTRFVCAILMTLYEKYDWFKDNKAYVRTLTLALNTMSDGGHLSTTNEMCQEVIDIGTRVKPYDFAKNYPQLSPQFTTYMAHLNYNLFFADRDFW